MRRREIVLSGMKGQINGDRDRVGKKRINREKEGGSGKEVRGRTDVRII